MAYPFEMAFGEYPAPPDYILPEGFDLTREIVYPWEIVVDNFCGGGGASEGIKMAIGRDPDVAINHDEEAVTMHQANHPGTYHYCQSIYKVDPFDVMLKFRRPIGLAWFSPDCTHHSKARGGKPKEKHIRDLAWVVVHWAERAVWDGKRPRTIYVENVEEFIDWTDLLPNGQPNPKTKGSEFKRWFNSMKKLGYRGRFGEIKACDQGAPTIRKRLFIVFRWDDQEIDWCKPTHGPGREHPYRTAAECIDFSNLGHSIFLTKEDGKIVRAKRPLANATLRRVAHGIDKYVVRSKKPFIVNLTHHGAERNEATDEPFRTITGANRGEKALVSPHITKFRTGSTGSSPEEPLHTITAGGKSSRPAGHAHAMGLVSPVLAGCGGRAGQSDPRPVDKPYHTTTSKADTCLIAPVLAGAGGPIYAGKPRSGGEPFNTIMKENHTAVIAPVLASLNSSKSEADHRTHDPREPINTIMTDPRHALLGVCLTEHANASNQRNFDAGEPLRTQCAEVKGGHFAMCGAALVQMGYGERDGQAPRSLDPEKPLGTITAGGKKHGLIAGHLVRHFGTSIGQSLHDPQATVVSKSKDSVIAAFLAQHNNHPDGAPNVGRAADEPASTVTTTGAQQGLVASSLVKLRGTCQHGQPSDEPAATVSAQGQHLAHTAAFLTEYYGNEKDGMPVDAPAHTVTSHDRFGLIQGGVQPEPLSPQQAARARAVADLMRSHGLWDEREFVIVNVDGASYIIADIYMRMLARRELFNAQGFRKDYIIDPLYKGKPMTNTASVRMCGNSVSPPPARDLIKANPIRTRTIGRARRRVAA